MCKKTISVNWLGEIYDCDFNQQINFRKNKVIVTASLPCYEKNNVDIQRGFGVFEKSINAIKILNDLGYGKKENGLKLNLVYNPVSPILPPSQKILERDYKKILVEQYNIVFNNLYTITNMPINRYEESLRSCLLYTSPSPRDNGRSRMPSSA